MNRGKTKKHATNMENEEEGNNMAVLAKNINLAFDLNPSKVKEFFEKTDKTAYKRAIERASLHNPKKKSK